MSFPRRRESSRFNVLWIFACAGMTGKMTFYETINFNTLEFPASSDAGNNINLDKGDIWKHKNYGCINSRTQS